MLQEEGKALHWTVIQDLALQRGYLDPFVQKDIRQRLIASLASAARDGDGPVAKTSTGVYALRESTE